MTKPQLFILILGAAMIGPILAAPVMSELAHDGLRHHHAKAPVLVPCDTDSDCIAKNPSIKFDL